jgi:SMODS-associating 4TM effector domain
MQQRKAGISQLQNTEASRTLLRAAFTSHKRAQRLQAIRTWLSLAVAGLAIVAAIEPSTAEAASVVGGVWALAYAATVNVSLNETRRAATLQEMFDVGIFGLPWNPMAAGHRIEHHEVSRLARRYRGPESRLVDYYDIPELPRPFDVLACQHQNLAWGSRVRSRFGTLLTIALIGWSSLGLVLAAAAGLTVSQLILAWFIPSLGALMMGVDIYREQQEVITIRTRALHLANERIAAALHTTDPDPGLEDFARQVQDAILITRQDQVRAPEWFYRCFQRSDRADFQVALARRFERFIGPVEGPQN